MGSQALKRSFDVLFSTAILIVASPILVLIAVGLFLQDRGSPIYFGRRVGPHGREFMLLKFRSMVIDADTIDVDTTAANDPRVTSLGPDHPPFQIG